MGVEAFEAIWGKVEELNRTAKLVIRVNRTKISSKKLKDILFRISKKTGIKTAQITTIGMH